MSVILVNSGLVHYEVLGRGRPLLYLHGWVGSWRYWVPTMQVTSTQFRSYALDFWGFGDTSHKPDHYSLDHQLFLIEEFLKDLGIGKIALIGHGLGAVMAFLFATRHPEQIDRLFAVGLPLQGERLNPRLRAGSPKELVDWLLSPDVTNEAARAEAPKADPLALQASMDGLKELNIETVLRKTNLPFLMVYGQNDPAVPPPDENDLLTLPETAHLVVFSQSGHFPMLDESLKFNRLLLEFLSLGSGESPRNLTLKEEWKRRVR